LVVEQLGDELLVFDSRTGEAHALSPLASSVFERCDGRTSFTEVAAEVGIPQADLLEVLEQLQERGLLEASPTPAGLSRREAVRRAALIGAGAAAAAPLIKSILVPTPAEALSVCQATKLLGEPCAATCECVVGCCCAGGQLSEPQCFSANNCALLGGTCP
jgi:Coenzyme PQQ synthesis protein D (PqqD)